jgi:cysteinyl-tRNA synthetase
VEDPIRVANELAAYWEKQFFDDMARLRILPPDTITRVSEYVPEIVAYVERIITNGYAYEVGGNVWFDVAKFEGAKGEKGGAWTHEYAKLQPGSKGNRKLIDEGEGELAAERHIGSR